MSVLLLVISLVLFLIWVARLRGIFLGSALVVFAVSFLILSRFHLRSTVGLIGALMITYFFILILSEILKVYHRRK